MSITLQELARLAGVSHTAVSLVLRDRAAGRVGQKTQAKIRALIQEHGYRPNVSARGLVQGRTYRVALAIYGYLAQRSVFGHYSLHDTLAIAAQQTQAAGYTIELLEMDPAQSPASLGRELAERTVDGVLLIGWPAAVAKPIVKRLTSQGMPSALVGAMLDDSQGTWCDVDRVRAIREATEQALSPAVESVAYLELAPDRGPRQAKREAFMTAAKEAGVNATSHAIEELVLDRVLSVAQDALEQVSGIPAFVLSDNYIGEGLMLALRLRGLKPGQDCRVIGLGDSFMAERSRPRLTHFSLMVKEQATFAVEALLEQIEQPEAYEPRQRLFRSELVELHT